uniref:Minor structural protein n=1 Tax=Norovirus Hu/GI.5/Siklos-HUN5407/2013/HUN TaxID=1486430 RepID=A0A023NEZ2_NORV|nr:minor structural protein [Norovirus Hu/GI.5/Siklos-HUN5407/2013/HUN]
MAQAIIGAIAASAAGSALGAGIQAGAEAALQSQRFQQDLTLQQNSFKHDKEMMSYQVEMSNALLAKNLNTRYALLQSGGLSSADAARAVAGAPVTRIVDWNGTRVAAPNSSVTTLRSGGFMSVPIPVQPKQKSPTTSGFNNPAYGETMSRVSSWVQSQNSSRSVSPFHNSALRTVWVTPPGSTSSSSVSSVPMGVFNTDRLPLFANRR